MFDFLEKNKCNCNRSSGNDLENNRPVTKPEPYVGNIHCAAEKNREFKKNYWTGCHLQVTLMSIACGKDIGMEIHKDTDQVIRVEHGQAMVKWGNCKENMNHCLYMQQGDVFFVPAGTWHNVINTGNCPLKLSSVYAPPRH